MLLTDHQNVLYSAQLSCLGQIGLGSVLLWDHVSFNELVENSFWKPAAMLIGEAIIGLLICWLGWNSTRKKNRCNLGLVSFDLYLYLHFHKTVFSFDITVQYSATDVVLYAFVCGLLGSRAAQRAAENRIGTI